MRKTSPFSTLSCISRSRSRLLRSWKRMLSCGVPGLSFKFPLEVFLNSEVSPQDRGPESSLPLPAEGQR